MNLDYGSVSSKRLSRLVGIVWIFAAIVFGYASVFYINSAHSWVLSPVATALGLLLAVGALVAVGNGIFSLFRPSRRVALWSFASAVAFVAVSAVAWVYLSVHGAIPSDSTLIAIRLLLPAVLLVLSGLVLILARRHRSTKLAVLAVLAWLVGFAAFAAFVVFVAPILLMFS